MKPMDPQQPGAIMILAEGQGRHVGPCRRGRGGEESEVAIVGCYECAARFLTSLKLKFSGRDFKQLRT